MLRTLSTTSGTYYIIVVFCEYIEIGKIAHAPVRVAGLRALAHVYIFLLSLLSLCDNEPLVEAVVETYIA